MYTTTLTTIDNGPGKWNYTKVSILDDGLNQVGEYIRNYPHYSKETFAPFKAKDGNWYALYSPTYTATRIMSLPDCKDIGGEEDKSYGFCPTEIWVPTYKKIEIQGTVYTLFEPEEPSNTINIIEEGYCSFAFISGCVWGDDSSWKLQLIGLSKCTEGILTRKASFGYCELMDDLSLKESVQILELEDDDDEEYCITVKGICHFNLSK